MKRIIVVSLFLFLIGCGSTGGFLAGFLSGDETIYRSATSARTVLTALETLRYHSAKTVAEAYVRGRVSKEQLLSFNEKDEKFRAAWAKASDLVTQWLAAKERPAGVIGAMNEVETLGAAVEAAGRSAQ